MTGDGLGFVLRIAENDGALGVFDLEHPDECIQLVAQHHVEEVADERGADLVARERDELRFVHAALGHALHVVVDGRGEAQELPVVGQCVHDRVELLREAHREHFIGFVEDQDLDAGSVERAAAQVVENTTGGAGDDLRPLLELCDLPLHGGAAIHGDRPQAAVLADLLEHALALEGELARGRQDQGLNAAIWGNQAVDEGQPKAKRLARAGPRLDDEVVAFDGGRKRGPLHWGRVREA